MADEVLPIKQGDTIYFYDTTIGDVASYSWQFTGGTPSTSTSPNEYVTFNGTNEGGYSVSFSVTSPSGITVGINKDNIISVAPETISSSFTISASTRLMSQNETYTSGATASSGITNYSWTIPGLGSTSGSNKTSVSHTENDWYNISGSYSGPVNSLFLATSTLTITSNVPNTSTTNQTVQYRKMGPGETYDLDSVGLTGPYYTPRVVSLDSGDIGIGGSSVVVSIDQSSSWSGDKFNNLYSHSTDEVLYFYPNSVDVSGGSSATPIRTRIILNKSQLDILGATYLENPSQFTSGSYILPGGISDIFDYTFYITDYTTTSSNAITSLLGERGWTNDDVNEFLKNTYYKSASTKYIETIKTASLISRYFYQTSYLGYDWSGGYTLIPESAEPGVMVPSSKFFDDYLLTTGEIDVALTIGIFDTGGNEIDTLRASISSGGELGNSPDGYIITTDGSFGISRILQDCINSSDFVDNIIIESHVKFSADSNITSSDFPGMRVSIIDPYNSAYNKNIGWITIDWDPLYLDQLSSFKDGDYLAYPFSTSTGNNYSFSGLPEKIGNFTSPQSTKRGWLLGGAVA